MKPLFLALALLLSSCSREHIDLKTPGNPVPATAGGIVDLGIVNGYIHHMSLSLSGVQIAMRGNGISLPNKGINVSMELFSSSDGVISDGKYARADPGNITPFTFRSGALYLDNAETGSYNVMAVSEGTMSVARTGTSYSITLEGKISSGESFTGHFKGVLSYMDTVTMY
jgi:hypothetical protein